MWFPRVLVLILVHLCIGQGFEFTPLGVRNAKPHVLPDLRIINGKDANPHAYPSIAFISINQGGRLFNCGGTLIADQFVLTAAHCLAPANTKVQKIYLGVHKYDRSDSVQDFTAASFVVHEEFKTDDSTAHDVALIKLSAPAKIQAGKVELAKMAALVTYPDKKDVYVGKQPTMFGWGLINEKPEKTPKVLQTIEGKVVAYSACKNAKRAKDNTLCMSRLDNKLGVACYGDSGGPLVLDGLLVGVVSGGSTSPMACHRSEFALFARVDYHRKWIDDKMKKMK